MGKASSSKKVARASRAGGKTKVRGSQGLVFPIALGVVILLGLSLIVYARRSQPTGTAEPPTTNDHWHTAYGIYICDKFIQPIQSQNDAVNGTPIGIHTHGDGVIHVHPFSSLATGANANLGTFFETSGIKMSAGKLELPEGKGTFKNGDDCAGKPGTVKVLVWDDANSTGAPKIYITDFSNIRFTKDRMAMTLAFVNDSTDLSTLRPPSIPTLDSLNDTGQTQPSTGTTSSTGATTATASGATTATSSGSATAQSTTTAPASGGTGTSTTSG